MLKLNIFCFNFELRKGFKLLGETLGEMIDYALLFIAVSAISTASIFAILANAPGVVASFWRFAISSIIFLLFYRKFPKNFATLKYSFIAGFFLAIHMVSWIESLFHASVALSTAIVCTHSIFSGIFSIFAGEKIKTKEIIGIGVAIVGIYFLSGADFYADIYGVILAFIGAIAGGVYFSTAKFARVVDFKEYITSTYIIATLTSFFISLLTKVDLVGYSIQTYLFLILLALIPMSAGHTILNYLIRKIKTITVTGSILGEVVGSTILSILVLGQKLTLVAYLYLAVILFGIFIAISGRD